MIRLWRRVGRHEGRGRWFSSGQEQCQELCLLSHPKPNNLQPQVIKYSILQFCSNSYTSLASDNGKAGIYNLIADYRIPSGNRYRNQLMGIYVGGTAIDVSQVDEH